MTRRDIVSGIQEADEEVVGAADGDDDVADRAVERAAGRDTEPARLVHHLDNVFQLAGGDSPSISGMTIVTNPGNPTFSFPHVHTWGILPEKFRMWLSGAIDGPTNIPT